MQSLLRYEALIKTADLGSFTRAAEALSYTQSGVSRMIAELEREWGVSLLARSRAGVHLTSEGAQLIDQVRRVCAEQHRLQDMVDDLNGLQKGLIRIGTLSSMATHWLPRIVRSFQADYPNIDYELLLGDYLEIEQWVLEGRVDCAFLRLPAHAQLHTRFLARDRMLAVLPEGHPLANGNPASSSTTEGFEPEDEEPAAPDGAESSALGSAGLAAPGCAEGSVSGSAGLATLDRVEEGAPIRGRVSLEALCQEPFLLLEKGRNDEIIRLFQKQGLTPDVRFTTWDDYAIMSMVENGLGVSILPELILRRCPYRIVTCELDPPSWRDIGVAMRSPDDLPLAVERFLQYVPAGVA